MSNTPRTRKSVGPHMQSNYRSDASMAITNRPRVRPMQAAELKNRDVCHNRVTKSVILNVQLRRPKTCGDADSYEKRPDFVTATGLHPQQNRPSVIPLYDSTFVSTVSRPKCNPVRDNLIANLRAHLPELRATLAKRSVPPVTIGIDAEWTVDPSRPGYNRVLSFQAHIITERGQACVGWLMPEDHRPTLTWLVATALSEARRADIMPHAPRQVWLATHFSKAELSHMADFDRRKRQVRAVRKTFITVDRPIRVSWYDASRNYHRVSVRVYDTMLLSPAGSSLEAIGDALGLAKLDLPPGYTKDRMDLLLTEQPEAFEAYALRDAEIAALYLQRITELSRTVLGKVRPPPTLGAFSVAFLKQMWKAADIKSHDVLGTYVRREREWTERKGRPWRTPKTVKKTLPVPERAQIDALASQAFHGGRNEALFCGISERGEWNDFDLIGAYSTALAAIRMPDWEAAFPCTDPAAFTADTLGVADVEFDFPPGTRYPCLPVRCDDRGLVFPLRGRAWIGAPEIASALGQSATLVVRSGWIVPWASDVRPFEGFVCETQRRRGTIKSTFEDRAWKEIGNSLYGKLAQSVHPKSGFDTRTGGTVPLPASKLTNPLIAAHVTSLVRACLGEHLAAVPPHRAVLSATTDGFLTDATLDELKRCGGPATAVMREARLCLSGSPDIIELKHCVASALVWRTRGTATVEPWRNAKPILAKGGLQLRGVADQNAEALRLYCERTPETIVTERHLTSIRALYEEEGDLQSIERTKRLRMEFDFKRRAARVCVRDGLLAFDTEPWTTADDFIVYREAFERWCNAGHVLKAVADWRDWQQHLSGSATSKAGVNRRGGLTEQARRVFLRAYVRRMWGLPGGSYTEIAAKLTALGYPTTLNDLKNAKRAAAPPEHTLPAEHPDVEEFASAMRAAFAGFDASMMLV